jgi:hypothetical protein
MQAAALATMGMAAFEEADYRQAIVYWQRLRDLEPPGSPGYDMLGQMIERANRSLVRPFPNRLPQQAWWSRSRYPGAAGAGRRRVICPGAPGRGGGRHADRCGPTNAIKLALDRAPG